ncbi:MAG TPA: hypothetical protein VNO32_36630, partial [Candidatus Acidoferrum sp.]|nr:hypothetical protein [Candidatus Acidoferrum sp.]
QRLRSHEEAAVNGYQQKLATVIDEKFVTNQGGQVRNCPISFPDRIPPLTSELGDDDLGLIKIRRGNPGIRYRVMAVQRRRFASGIFCFQRASIQNIKMADICSLVNTVEHDSLLAS